MKIILDSYKKCPIEINFEKNDITCDFYDFIAHAVNDLQKRKKAVEVIEYMAQAPFMVQFADEFLVDECYELEKLVDTIETICDDYDEGEMYDTIIILRDKIRKLQKIAYEKGAITCD